MVWYHKLKNKRVLDCDASPAPLGTGLPLTSWPAAGVRGEPRPEAGFRMDRDGVTRRVTGGPRSSAGMKGWSQGGRPREKTPLALVLGWKIHSHPQQEPWYTTSHTHRCSERENINRETDTDILAYDRTHTQRILIRPLTSGTMHTHIQTHQSKHPSTHLPTARNTDSQIETGSFKEGTCPSIYWERAHTPVHRKTAWIRVLKTMQLI